MCGTTEAESRELFWTLVASERRDLARELIDVLLLWMQKLKVRACTPKVSS
jgi:hypothetical protein